MADVTAPAEPAQRLIEAVRRGEAGEVQLLVDSNPALAETRDASGVSAILLALYHGQREIAGRLAARRTELDIFEASSLGNTDRIQALLTADPTLTDARSPDGFTALALASFLGQLAAVRLLVARGADVNAAGRTPPHYTPLTGAVTARHADVVAELLRNGAEPNYRYGAGHTPLHVAAANGSAAIVRLLLAAGASREARTDESRTPLDLARENGHGEVMQLLS
jgi:ankyrin repeat protein